MTAKTTTELKAEIKNLKAKVSSREKQIDNLNLEILDRDSAAREKNDSLLKQLAEKNLEFETARDTWMRSNEELSKDSNIVRAFNKEIGENNVDLQKTIKELHNRLIESDECMEIQKLELIDAHNQNYQLEKSNENMKFFKTLLTCLCITEIILIVALSYLKTK